MRSVDGLDDGAASEVSFDLRCNAALLPGREDLELMLGWRVVAAVSGVGDDALVADCSLPTMFSMVWDEITRLAKDIATMTVFDAPLETAFKETSNT